MNSYRIFVEFYKDGIEYSECFYNITAARAIYLTKKKHGKNIELLPHGTRVKFNYYKPPPPPPDYVPMVWPVEPTRGRKRKSATFE